MSFANELAICIVHAHASGFLGRITTHRIAHRSALFFGHGSAFAHVAFAHHFLFAMLHFNTCSALSVVRTFTESFTCNERSDNQRNNRHQFDQNVHRRTRSVLERITHCITRYRCFVWLRFFVEHLAVDHYTLFERLLGVIPCTTGI